MFKRPRGRPKKIQALDEAKGDARRKPGRPKKIQTLDEANVDT